MSFSQDNLKGVILALLSSGFIGASFIIKKKGLRRAAAASGVRAGIGGFSYLLEPLWWVGMITMIVGEIANFVAYAFAPAVLVTPLGALSIIVSAVLAHFLLNEKLYKLGILGCVMCIAGSVVIVIHAPQERPITSVQEIWNMATQPAFLLYVASVIVLVFILVFHFVPSCGHSNVLVFTGICSLMGSLSNSITQSNISRLRLLSLPDCQGSPCPLCSIVVHTNTQEQQQQQQLCPCTGYQDKFVRGVSQLLESYDVGTQVIRCFSVSFCVRSFAGDVDGWVRSAIKMRAQTLLLRLYCPHKASASTWADILREPPSDKYLFRSELLEGAQTNLRHLHLCGCNLGPNFTNQFSSLESLRLSHASLSQYDLQSLFSSLVKLKVLSLRGCNLPQKLCLGPLLRLQRFKLVFCCGVATIELSNANLSKFNYDGARRFTLIFKQVPKLWKFYCNPISKRQFLHTFTLLPQQVPMLRELYIKTEKDWVNRIPGIISTFTRVTILRLDFFEQMKFDVLKMVSIFKAFPLLRRLHLMMCCREDVEQGQLDQHGGYVHEHLREVEFCGFCTSNQIEFAIFMLKHASILKRLVIRKHKWYSAFCSEICKNKNQWKTGERNKVYKRLKEFAGNARVRCLV